MVLVLTGYLLVLSGSSVGYGWGLLTHLLSQHHGTGIEQPVLVDAHRHGTAADNDPAHHHGPSSTRPAAHHHRPAGHDHAPPDVRPPRNAPHEHDGRTHTHERSSDADPAAPALLTLALDKHCLFSGVTLPPPPSRDRAASRPVAAPLPSALPVEVPPPRLLG